MKCFEKQDYLFFTNSDNPGDPVYRWDNLTEFFKATVYDKKDMVGFDEIEIPSIIEYKIIKGCFTKDNLRVVLYLLER